MTMKWVQLNINKNKKISWVMNTKFDRIKYLITLPK